MISNRCARKSLVTNCNSIISKNYLRFLVDSNDMIHYFIVGLGYAIADALAIPVFLRIPVTAVILLFAGYLFLLVTSLFRNIQNGYSDEKMALMLIL